MGTLTCNDMVFQCCSAVGYAYADMAIGIGEETMMMGRMSGKDLCGNEEYFGLGWYWC